MQADEFDTGVRQKLNLGHTIAHGIETASEYQVSHGQAVATGMAIIAKAAMNRGYCSASVCADIRSIVERFALPLETPYTAHVLFLSALSDKKRAGSIVNLIIPREIGNCEIVPIPVSELESFIKAGL